MRLLLKISGGTFYQIQTLYIYTLVFKKVGKSKKYISFVSLGETKEKTKDYIFIYISKMSTFLKTSVYIYLNICDLCEFHTMCLY